jgi:hypothetical protein
MAGHKNKEIIVMTPQSRYSVIVILVIFAGCVVFGAENASDINETKADTPLISIAPIEVNIPPIKVLPVKVNVQPKGDNLWTIIMAAIAFAAALAAWMAAKNTRLVAEGELFAKQIEKYSSDKMHEDLDKIFVWYDTVQNNNTTGVIFEKAGEKVQEPEFDKARRHVTHYFLKILDVDKSDYTTKKCFFTKGKWFVCKKVFAKHVCEAVSTNVLFPLFPLECAKDAKIGKKDGKKKEDIMKELKKLEGKFDKLLSLSGEASLSKRFPDWEKACEELLKEAEERGSNE